MNRRGVRVAAALVAALLLAAAGCSSSTCKSGAKCKAKPPGSGTGTSSASPAKHAANRWYRIPSPPGGARQEVAAAAVAGKIYVVGGLIGNGKNTSLVEAFDPKRETWSRVPALPDAVDHAMAAGLGGRLYVMGGFSGQGRAASRSVFVFDGTRWSTAASLREPRAAGAAVTVGKKIFVIGGIAGAKHVTTTESFDGTSWSENRVYSSTLDHIAATTDGKRIFVAGGRTGGKLTYDTFQVYEPRTIPFWGPLPKLPTGRSGLGAAVVKGKVFVVGGEGGRIFPEVEAYDYVRKTWRRLPDLRVPRHGIGVVAVGATIYTLLGGDEPGLAPSAACEAFVLG